MGWKVSNGARRNYQPRHKEKKREVWDKKTSDIICASSNWRSSSACKSASRFFPLTPALDMSLILCSASVNLSPVLSPSCTSAKYLLFHLNPSSRTLLHFVIPLLTAFTSSPFLSSFATKCCHVKIK